MATTGDPRAASGTPGRPARRDPWRVRDLMKAEVTVVPALGIAVFLFDHRQAQVLSIAMIVGWLPLILVAARDALRRS